MIVRAAGLWVAGLSLVAAACGGGGGGAPAPGTPARQNAAAAAAAAEEGGGRPATPAKAGARPAGRRSVVVEVPAGDSTQLQREVFAYRGSGRDPFQSLMNSADVRPLVTDVRVAGITFDATYPARSVAVLRDTAQKKRYTVRVGDELGRMKVTQIRRNAVVVNLDEFGTERQVVLPVRRREQEETP